MVLLRTTVATRATIAAALVITRTGEREREREIERERERERACLHINYTVYIWLKER